jgi:nucleotide-binding universal stress UspA family protein
MVVYYSRRTVLARTEVVDAPRLLPSRVSARIEVLGSEPHPSVERILVSLDTSAHTPKVLAAAVDLARRTSARLTVFRSVEVPTRIAQPSPLTEVLMAAARERLLRQCREVPADLLDTVDVRIGGAWSATCEKAKQLDADLIVIALHGFVARGYTAANSNERATHADCSVMVVV